MEKKDIKLIALDMDGTLFNPESIVTEGNREAIRKATEQGITVIISTGRPFAGLPAELLAELGVKYAITTNGSTICEVPSGRFINRRPFDREYVLGIVEKLLQWRIFVDVFSGGLAYTPSYCFEFLDSVGYPDSVKAYIKKTRVPVEDVLSYIRENEHIVDKITLNFIMEGDTPLYREEVKRFLESIDGINLVTGGFHNLEFTRGDVSKGNALELLSGELGIDMSQTMAIGDTENDLSIIQAAGVGVAMGNADDYVKGFADYITDDNAHDGVAKAIYEIAMGN